MVELLAPAGDMECLHAAVCAGADAVYLGLDEFNARRNAGNFTIEALREACDYAHLRNVAIYVALNVEVLPSELDRAVTLARRAYEAGADAFILQDVGLARALRAELPRAELHASTQMNIHSAAGMAAAAQLGLSRVTLARELSLPEIAELSRVADQLGIEIECFAHGALCICYSGQCLMSSMIGGRSANRGLCAQACRLPYELHCAGKNGGLPCEGEHLLSPRDLCTIDLLEDLVSAGVASLKIEGRMKSADYVHEVTSIYREALERQAEGGLTAEETLAAKGRLAEAFSRGFTTAYLTGERGNDMMSYGRPNNRGVFVGRVSRVDNQIAEIASEVTLHEGDVLEFWTNKGHFAETVPDVPHGTIVKIPVAQRTSKGDRVFRVRNAATTFTSLSEDSQAPRIPISGLAVIRAGQPAYMRFWTSEGVAGEAEGAMVECARTKELAEHDVRSHVDRLGQTPFTLREFDLELDAGVGMAFSTLHHMRRLALEDLAANLLDTWKASRSNRQATSGEAPGMLHSPTGRARNASECFIAAWATNPDCARAAKRAGADGVYVPLLNFRRGQAQLAGTRIGAASQAGYPKQCIMALPAVEHDPVEGTREYASAFDPWDYVREEKPVFADSLADAVRALDVGARVEIGPHVPLANRAALEHAADMGASRVWLSPELTLGQIAELAESSPVALGISVCGAQELMICEHCLLMSQGPCSQSCEQCPRRSVEHWLVDRKGFKFPVATDTLGRSHLYNGIELDAVPTVPDLIETGVTAFMVDATLMDAKSTEAAIKRVTRAVDAAFGQGRVPDRRTGTTTGHLFRGVT